MICLRSTITTFQKAAPTSTTAAEPLFEFGYGLSYTKYAYADLQLSQPVYANGETLKLNFALKNTGSMDGDEVAQVYVKIC